MVSSLLYSVFFVVVYFEVLTYRVSPSDLELLSFRVSPSDLEYYYIVKNQVGKPGTFGNCYKGFNKKTKKVLETKESQQHQKQAEPHHSPTTTGGGDHDPSTGGGGGRRCTIYMYHHSHFFCLVSHCFLVCLCQGQVLGTGERKPSHLLLNPWHGSWGFSH